MGAGKQGRRWDSGRERSRGGNEPAPESRRGERSARRPAESASYIGVCEIFSLEQQGLPGFPGKGAGEAVPGIQPGSVSRTSAVELIGPARNPGLGNTHRDDLQAQLFEEFVESLPGNLIAAPIDFQADIDLVGRQD